MLYISFFNWLNSTSTGIKLFRDEVYIYIDSLMFSKGKHVTFS